MSPNTVQNVFSDTYPGGRTSGGSSITLNSASMTRLSMLNSSTWENP